MSELSSRRSFLRLSAALATSGAAGAALISTVGAAGPTRVQALYADYLVQTETEDRLWNLAVAASDRFTQTRPPIPDALFVSPLHAHLGGLREFTLIEYRDGEEYWWIPAEGWRHAITQPLAPSEQGEFAEYQILTRYREHARRTLPIAERYEEAVKEAERTSGHEEADRAWNEARAKQRQAMEALLAATAETPDDLLLQIAVLEMETGDEGDDVEGFLAMGLFASARALRGAAACSGIASRNGGTNV